MAKLLAHQLPAEADRAAGHDLTARELAYLHESNAIENIFNVDYSRRENQDGHVVALVDALRLGQMRSALTVTDLCRWQGLVCGEQLRFGHSLPPGGVGVLRGPAYPMNVRVGTHIAPLADEVPALVDRLVADLAARIPEASRNSGAVDYADCVGAFFQRFEAIHPFVDGNGRTGRLLASYISAAHGMPLIVFRAAERPAFYAAHRSKLAMKVFMADKDPRGRVRPAWRAAGARQYGRHV